MPLYALGEVRPTVPAPDEFWLAPDAHVIGNVVIGRNVGIWFGAVVRGDNDPIVIGERTNIQDGVMLHADPQFPLTIGSGCTLGHHAIVHGCTIGNNVLVGMGATILNGAIIGDNCLVGANALVTEGRAFPAGSLILGAPAKAVRMLDEPAIARMRRSADRYVANARRYAAGLRAL